MQKLLQDFSIPAVFAGFITFLIGISVSAVLVIQAAQILGATPEQITSWFWALGLGIGLSGFILSWKFKYPVATSWSTAGLALILATGSGYSLYEAIGAFFICGLLTAILGFLGIFQKVLSYIPQSLTSAMLAGVLLKFGIALFASMQNDWGFILSLLAVYILSKRLSPRYCIVITVIAGLVLCPIFMEFHVPALQWSLAKPVWMTPDFTWSAILGLALPLFVINMASQYLPGIAMIKSYGYQPHVNQLVGWTGVTLFATISHNVALAFANVEEREAALLTFLCSASGVQFWGIGSAFWGLILGIFVLILFRLKLKNKP